ncbi:MAG: hypothetical protein E6Q67_03230 [Roseateles sp.]|nr:MAG: hypothetical protein E6Q67_03230 [Roseateles sp.]
MRVNVELNTCLVAIQRTSKQEPVSAADSRTLRLAYVLARLIECSLLYPELLDQAGMVLTARYMALVRQHLVVPTDGQRGPSIAGLGRQAELAASNQLEPAFHEGIEMIHRAFMSNFLAGIQADVIGLSTRAPRSPDEDTAFVVGMAEVTANNFSAMADFSGADLALDTITGFIPEGCRFAAAVRRELANLSASA